VTCRRFDTQQVTVLRYSYEPHARFPSHSHPEEQLVLVLRGEIEFTMAGRTVRVGADSVVLIPPGMVHSAGVLSETPVDTINILSPRRRRRIVFTSDQEEPAKESPTHPDELA
jgi:quercetin dioxygenase-like cupin family protein